ncbi:MAG: hypothetical protein ABSE16_14680 [Verrucomicrobiota bacterium]
MNLTSEQKETLRHAIIEALAIRHPAALTVRQIWNLAKKDLDFKFEFDDVLAALTLLRELKLCSKLPDELGATDYFRALPEAVLKFERGEI